MSVTLVQLLLLLLLLTPLAIAQDLTLKQIRSFGVDGEAFEVETEDGYRLTVHHLIPRGSANASRACLIMHGILCSSAEFLLTERTSLALYLHQSGFDVYLGNVRGSRYSMSHRHFHPDGSEFWDFSVHELAHYDLPAIIDAVLQRTGAERLVYIGHSQGATIPLMLLSSRPEYNGKISQLHLSSPAPFMTHFPNTVIRRFGKRAVKRLARHNQLDFTALFAFLESALLDNCRRNRPAYLVVCIMVEFVLLGDNFGRYEGDIDVFPGLLPLLSPNVSSMQALHFFQFIETGEFKRFDYGRVENLRRYGVEKPPAYDLSRVVTPSYIYCAERDGVVARQDIEHLRDVLPNVKSFKLLKNYNHLDFDIGINARRDVHSDIVRAMNGTNSLRSAPTESNPNSIWSWLLSFLP